VTTLRQDLRYAVRMLVNSPGFACIAVLTLALGIGASTALFSVVNGVLLNPLPFPHSEQLVRVYAKTAASDRDPIVYLNFLDWQRMTQTLSSMATYRNQDYNFTGKDESQRLTGYMISAGFFPTLGVNPVLGRLFRVEDDQLGAGPVVVLGGGFWAREFGSQDVIGKALVLNAVSYTIVGVVPASFRFYGRDRDVYTPIGQWNDPSFRDRRISVSAHSIGRLKTGVSLAQAKADMDMVARHLGEEYPVADKDVGIAVVGMKEDMVGDVTPYLLVLLSAVGFLLLIACSNVANLLLARSMGRSREFALRAALGAGQARIVRQLLTESVVLGGVGGVLGWLFALGAVRLMIHGLPSALPRVEEISMDARAAVFATTVSVAAAILFGLSPAFRGARVNLQEVLKEGGRGASGRHRLQSAFVALEVAMAMILLVGAGLMLRSLAALWRVNLGYNPMHAITFSLSMPSSGATTSAETRARLRRFEEKMRSIPGVQEVSVTLGSRPMIHDSAVPLWIEGRPKPATDGEMPGAMFYLAEPGFQQAMGITLLRGRFLSDQDRENTPIVIDIDDVFARDQFPNEDPIGRHVNITQFNVQAEIVGVVGHVRQWGPGGDGKSAVQAEFFYPYMQIPEKLMAMIAGGSAVVLRTYGDPPDMLKLVRRGVEEIDRRYVIYNVQTMEDVIAGSLAPRRVSMLLLAIFAGLALLLACVGIYGVVAYLVGERTHEIGVRMALGAQRGDVMRLVLGEGAKMTVAGLAAGVAGAMALTRLMADALYGVTAQDPATYGAVAVMLMVVALAACYLPARRAVRVDPVTALRGL